MSYQRIAVGIAAIVIAGCATTGETGKTGSAKTGTSGRKSGPTEGGAGPVEISSKAKLGFEDAVKAFEAQKKAGQYDYPSLEKKFKAASDADPNLAEADYNLGVIAERQGKTKEAVAYYKEALNKKPTLRQAAENLAVIAQNQGDEKGAVALYEGLLSSYPDDASSRARLAEIYRRRGESDKAMELAREALFRDPKTLQAFKTMIQLNVDQKQYAMARLIALRAMRIEENDPEIYYMVGLINLAEKDPIKARVQFKRAIDARADFLPAHYQLVKMAFDQEDYGGAETHLRRILQANGNNPEALVDLGVAYKGLGQLDKAMQAYDAAQKVKGDIPELYLNRGIIIGLKGEPEKAIVYFKQYIQLKPDVQVDGNHAVHTLIKDQEAIIQHREDEKKSMEEAAKMEAEAKKLEDAAKEDERKKKEEEFQKQQSSAKGKGEATAPAPEKAPPAAKKPPEPKPDAAKAPAAEKKPAADEPSDGL